MPESSDHPQRLPADFDRQSLPTFTPIWEHTAAPPPASLTRQERLHDHITGWLGILGAALVGSCILASLLLIVRVVSITSDTPGPLAALLPGLYWIDSLATGIALAALVTGLTLLMRRKRLFYAWPILAGLLTLAGYLTWRALASGPTCTPGALRDCAAQAVLTSHLHFDSIARAIAAGFFLLLVLLVASPLARKTLRR